MYGSKMGLNLIAAGLIFISGITSISAEDASKTSTSSISLEHVTLNKLACHMTTEIGQTFILSWYKSGQWISKRNYTNVKSKTLSSTYTLGITKATSGVYSCEIKTEDGTQASNSILINRDQPYLKLSLPKSRSVSLSLRVNQTISIPFNVTCIVTSFPRANITFMRNGRPLNIDDSNIVISSSEKGDTVTYNLMLRRPSHRDIGDYNCRAGAGDLRDTITGNKINLIGDDCLDELLETGRQYRCPNNPDKCVSKVSCDSREKCVSYKCEKPDKPQDAKIISCTHDTAQILWKLDKKAKTNTVFIDRDGHASYHKPTVSNSIKVGGLLSNTMYTFAISAENDVGQSKSQYLNCKTTKFVRPSQVLNPEVTQVNNKLILGWTPNVDVNQPPSKLAFNVTYCLHVDAKKGAKSNGCKSQKTNDTWVHLKDVQVNKVYEFSVVAINDGGIRGEKNVLYYAIPSNLYEGSTSVASNICVSMLVTFGIVLGAVVMNMTR